jgi:hypothetical protein
MDQTITDRYEDSGALNHLQTKLGRIIQLIHALLLLLSVYLALIWAGSSSIPAEEAALRRLAQTVSNYQFHLLTWELYAIGGKVRSYFNPALDRVEDVEAVQIVEEYWRRAQKIYQLEDEMERAASDNPAPTMGSFRRSQREIDTLRQEQDKARMVVEQIIQQQIDQILTEEEFSAFGIVLPPVQFVFVEPPKKMVVSPRDRIATIYGQMLTAEIRLEEIQQVEQSIRDEQNLSAYITNIGGLGAYPTMVVDNASLAWILSTVAHEWAHNYLTFFPLGFYYGINSDNIIINETVAEIVGNEVGDKALRRYYPQLIEPHHPLTDTVEAPIDPLAFDFNAEMRQTRVTADQLLALEEVEEAERYMELRRQYFVENGYPIRLLNQAYFAFHGSYGTGAASTSPLGPNLERLRQLTPNLLTFLQVVRSLQTLADVENALREWENKPSAH